MRVLKSKSLNNLILAVLLSLPFVAVASRCIYVQANKNAYQSYSGQPLEYETTQLTSINDIELLNTYMFSNVGTYSSNVDTNYIGYTDISNIETNNVALKTSLESGSYFRFTYQSNNKNVIVYDSDLSMIRSEVMNQQTITFNFVITSYQINSLSNVSMFYTFEIANNSYLDNVFEYSVSKFIKENDFGNIDLTSWFSGMFLSNTSHNNLYVGFANWYLNYAMLITMVHFLFLILMWFINFCRRLIDRSVNYDW